MKPEIIASLIGSLISALGLIIVALIQTQPKNEEKPTELLVPEGYKVHRPRATKINIWAYLLPITLLGGSLSYFSVLWIFNPLPLQATEAPSITGTSKESPATPLLTANATQKTISVQITPSSTNPSLQSTPESIKLGMILFSDDFESGTADKFRNMVGLWKLVKDETGNWVYEIDTLRKNEWAHSMFGESSWSNYSIEYRIRILDFTSSPNVGAQVGFRSAATDNLWHAYYSVDLVPNNQGLWLGYGDDILKKYRMLASTDFHIEKNIWYKMRVEVTGTSIKVFVNDNEELNAYDAELTTGSLGFRVGPGMKTQYDDVLITEIVP